MIPTYEENPKFWDELAKKHQRAFMICKAMQERGCPWCKKKTLDFESMAFHIASTHGIPRDILVLAIIEEDLK